MSTDGAEKLERFRQERDLPFALVSDGSGAIARAYRARWPIVAVARRVTYLVGRDRRVRLAFHSERRFAEHAAHVLREASAG